MVEYTLYMEGGDDFYESPNCSHPDEFYVLDRSQNGRMIGERIKAQTLADLTAEVHKTNNNVGLPLKQGDVINTISTPRVLHDRIMLPVSLENMVYFKTLLAEPNYFGKKY